MTSIEYWARRAAEREAAAQAVSGKTAGLIRRAYNKAVAGIERDIKKIVKKYPDLADQPERARVARLEEVRENIAATVRTLGGYEYAATTKRYVDVMTEGYYRFLYDLQKGVKIGFHVAQIPQEAVMAALKDGWQGHSYSASVWRNTEVLAEKVSEAVTAGLLRGASIGDMAAEVERLAADVQEAANLGKYCAERLIRTETNFFSNQGELLAYDEAGIDEYQFLATLDSRTSEECREHDGKVYPVSAAQTGSNYPPLHPFCRSTTVAWFGEEAIKGFERRARDPATGKQYKVPADMAYEEWKTTFVKPDGTNTLDIATKMAHNERKDAAQLADYKALLPGAPTNLKDFQQIKYHDAGAYEKLKAQAREARRASALTTPSENAIMNSAGAAAWRPSAQ